MGIQVKNPPAKDKDNDDGGAHDGDGFLVSSLPGVFPGKHGVLHKVRETRFYAISRRDQKNKTRISNDGEKVS